jgi:heme oxygenase
VRSALESALDRHASHPALAPTYNPSLLARAPSLASDISSFLQVPESSWETHPAHLAFLAHLPGALTNYLDRIHTLAEGDETPSLLLAHAYVRYLGDLSGGQIMKRRIAKAYALDPDDHDAAGVAFYEFRTLDGSGFARIGDMKKIKEWFRDGMNAAAGNDVRFKGAHKLFLLWFLASFVVMTLLPQTSHHAARSTRGVCT